ncbi:MAG TPA: hypothetical protein VFZ65_09025 [Planctomycetota bacterium]|nr:hypothetical protein [Planctomycetota bacterium]
MFPARRLLPPASPLTWLVLAGLPAPATPAQTAAAPPPKQWRSTPLGEHDWQGYTHAVTIAGTAYLLHGTDAEVVHADGSFDHWPDVLPRAVDAFSAVAALADAAIVVLPGRGELAFRFDATTRKASDLPGLALATGRGARAVDDGAGGIVCMPAGGDNELLRYRDGQLERLPPVDTVNRPGKYASGLFRIDHRLLAFGDHHVSSFDLETRTWAGTTHLFLVLGFRPALDRGGMVFQEPESHVMFMTHGKDSRAVGMLTPDRQFYYLRPRLPIGLRDAGQTLFSTGTGASRQIHVLSQLHHTLFSIALVGLEVVSIVDRAVEAGSRWQVLNLWAGGVSGDLVRERDSVGNLVFLDPEVFAQRKFLLRSNGYDDWAYSPADDAPVFGKNFATEGAALCTDGARIYLTNGYSDEFFCLDLHTKKNRQHVTQRLPINDALVRHLSPLRSFPAATGNDDLPRNMTMVCHQGLVYALRDPVTRILYCYDPALDLWSEPTLIPSAMHYTDELGADLMSDGERLLLLSGDAITTWTRDRGWGPVHPLGFRYSSDGGMAIYDPVAKLVYVVLGGRSRDLAVVDPADGTNRVLADFLPDVVSVYGRRLFLCERDGVRYLNLQRGHDSAEYWRTAISGEFALSPR